jgi:hypothetical protein
MDEYKFYFYTRKRKVVDATLWPEDSDRSGGVGYYRSIGQMATRLELYCTVQASKRREGRQLLFLREEAFTQHGT